MWAPINTQSSCYRLKRNVHDTGPDDPEVLLVRIFRTLRIIDRGPVGCGLLVAILHQAGDDGRPMSLWWAPVPRPVGGSRTEFRPRVVRGGGSAARGAAPGPARLPGLAVGQNCMILIPDLIHELLRIRTGHARFAACETTVCPRNRVCGCERPDYGSEGL
jgi:hypothetical protein